jgi:hypothetical protein
MPIALSMVEGYAQSLRFNVGRLEYWSKGVMHLKPNTPILQHPISLITVRST